MKTYWGSGGTTPRRIQLLVSHYKELATAADT